MNRPFRGNIKVDVIPACSSIAVLDVQGAAAQVLAISEGRHSQPQWVALQSDGTLQLVWDELWR